MWHGSLAEWDSPSHNTIFDGRCHRRPGSDRHLDIRTRREECCSHPTLIHLILKQDPLAHTSLAVVVAGAEPRVISRFLEPVVQVSIDEEFDSFFDGYLVTADRPVSFGLLAGIEPVDVDECAVTIAESLPQDGFVGEGALQDRDVVEREEIGGSSRGGGAAKESNGVFLVGDQGTNDGDALGSGAAYDKDSRDGVHRASQTLDDGGVGHAAALAHGLQRVPAAALL